VTDAEVRALKPDVSEEEAAARVKRLFAPDPNALSPREAIAFAVLSPMMYWFVSTQPEPELAMMGGPATSLVAAFLALLVIVVFNGIWSFFRGLWGLWRRLFAAVHGARGAPLR
jgi:hypothetical protein